MSQNYSRKLLQISLAQICQNLGWNAIQSTPLEILTDILERYMLEMAKVTHRYSEQFGRTSPNLNDVGLAFQQFGVHMEELENYVRHMDPVPFAHPTVAFPVPKKNNLQIPNPDSKEIRQRDEHIFDYLPAMFPGMEEESEPIMSPPATGILTPQHESPSTSGLTSPVAGEKRPISSPGEGPVFKRPKIITSTLPDEAGHSQYEMMNVSMSQTGFLTPTRGQGKLPDACTPPPANIIVVEPKIPKTVESVEKKSKELTVSTDSEKKKTSSKKITAGGILNLTNNAVPVEKLKKLSNNPVLKIKEVKKKLSKSPLVTKPKQRSPGRPPKKVKSSSKKESKLKELLLITAGKKADSKLEKRSESPRPSPVSSKSRTENLDSVPEDNVQTEKDLPVQQIKSEPKDIYESPDDDSSSGSRLVIAENVGKGKLSKEAKQARSAAIMESIDSVVKQSSQDSGSKSQQRETTYLVKEDGSMIKIGEKIKVKSKSKTDTDPNTDSDIEDSESLQQTCKTSTDIGKKSDSKNTVKYSSVESINASIDSVIFQSSSEPISDSQIKSEVTDEDTFPYAGTPDRSTPSTPRDEKEIKEESEESKTKDKEQGVRDKLKEKLKKKSSSQDSEELVSKKKSNSMDSEESDIFSGTEKSSKGPISIYDFPESPPTRPFHLQSSSRTSSESMDVPVRKTDIPSDKPKEKVKEKSKDKQHKKDKKDRKKDKEKKKKNKNRDKHRTDRSKEEFDESSAPFVPRIKLNIRIGSSPSVSPAVSISTESRFSSPKAEPSPSSTPTRPEIPKLVIKPVVPQTSTPDVKPPVSPPHTAPVKKTAPITPSRRGRPPKRRGQRGRRPGSPAVARRFSAPFEFNTGSTAAVKEEAHSDHEDSINRFPIPFLASSDSEPHRSTPPMLMPSSLDLVFNTGPKTDQLPPASSDQDTSKHSPPVLSPPRNTSLSPVHSSPSLPPTPANNPSPSSPSLPPQSPSPPPHSPSPHTQSHTPSPPHTPSPAASHMSSPPCSPVASPAKPSTVSPKKEAPDIPPMPPPSILSSSAIPPMPPPSKAGLTKQRTVITETVATYEDASGDRVWICPGCEQPDDGSPMIGCDSCDEWYHWPCVNIVAAPREDENWYCPKCNPTRKQPKKKNLAPKKRGRKKKNP